MDASEAMQIKTKTRCNDRRIDRMGVSWLIVCLQTTGTSDYKFLGTLRFMETSKTISSSVHL